MSYTFLPQRSKLFLRKNVLYFFSKIKAVKKFIIFQETERSSLKFKKLLTFQERELSYIFSKKIFLLYFGKWNPLYLRRLKRKKKNSHSENFFPKPEKSSFIPGENLQSLKIKNFLHFLSHFLFVGSAKEKSFLYFPI